MSSMFALAPTVVRRRLGLWLGAVLSLALAFAGATAVFAIVDSALLKALPYPDADSVVWIVREQGPERVGPPVSGPAFVDLARDQRSFAQFSANTTGSAVMTGRGNADRLGTTLVSADYFAVLGMPAFRGRLLGPDDLKPDAAPAVVLSHGAWLRRFGADETVVGSTITLDGVGTTVVGIASPDVLLPGRSDVALPMKMPAGGGSRGNNSLILVGRLAPGVTLAQAQAEFDTLAAKLAQTYPDNHAELKLRLRPLGEAVTEGTRSIVRLLGGAIVLLLVVGAASLLNLLMADVFGRRREFATRSALGGSRSRLLLHFGLECGVMVAIAALAGLALGHLALQNLLVDAAGWIRRPDAVHIGAPEIAATFGLALLIALVTTAIAGARLGRGALVSALRSGARAGALDAGGQRVRRLLVVAQIGLSLVLLIGAGLLSESVRRVLQQDPGFDPAQVALARVTLDTGTHKPDDPQGIERRGRTLATVTAMENELRGLPGVHDAGYVLRAPIAQGPGGNGDLNIVGDAPFATGTAPLIEFQLITPGYFRAMGLKVLAGRMFAEPGAEQDDTALINNAFAQRHFAGRDPLQHKLAMIDGRERRIVGVVQDVRQDGLAGTARPEMYVTLDGLTFGDFMPRSQDLTLVMRSTLPTDALAPVVREAMARADASVPVFQFERMTDAVERSTAQRRLLARVMQFFGATALAIAIVGLYGLIGHAVTQRTGEFGVRMALGARARDVAAVVAREGAVLVAAGLVVGLVVALAAARVLESHLFGLSARDPSVIASLCGLLAVCAALALVLPARRASRISPMQALRDE